MGNKILFILQTIGIILHLFTFGFAQKGIDYSKTYSAGGRLLMNVDSAAKNVYYNYSFPNQPRTDFSYLPQAESVSIQIYFRKTENIRNFRYTILSDNKPIVVNNLIPTSTLKEVIRPDINNEAEVMDYTSLGIFPIKDVTLTVLIYNVENPLNIQKSVFYGRSFPEASITAFIKHFRTDKGFESKPLFDPEKSIDITFNQEDIGLTLIKNKTNIDYLYKTIIKNKQNDEIIFEGTAWDFTIISEDGTDLLPSMKIDKNVFKKSGDYEIIIEPSMNWDHCWQCGISTNEVENYASRYLLSITLDNESYTKKDIITYLTVITCSLALLFLLVFYLVKNRNKKRLALKEQQENITKLKLNAIRSQLNPHFLFNALASIQNLMNKNEIDNANKYLAKFARLTRMVLDEKELISLSQEKDLLDDYLQMEQLRFGFKYEINQSDILELDNIEIPNMLLQTFVENAVKHGITQRAEHGEIIINFVKKENDLILIVTDNGNGFEPTANSVGLGLQLSKNRIDLLNNMYKENQFILAILSNSEGTKISITLKEWL